MTYLRTFRIPSDLWVCWYFHPWDSALEPPPHDMPAEFYGMHPEHRSYHNTWYPWNVFENRFIPDGVHTISNIFCPEILFSDLTIFYGGNGSGKSTLLNVIAEKIGSERLVSHNTSPFFSDYVTQCDFELHPNYCSCDAIRSRIISSDEVFEHLLSLRDNNAQIVNQREKLSREYYMDKSISLPSHLDPSNLSQQREYHGMREDKRLSLSAYINKRLDRTGIEKSNGETAFNYFYETFKHDRLILLDEPENSLSAMWQKDLALLLRGAMRESRCQFIIATHSPFFLSIPHARIYNLDSVPIKEAKWNELESMQCYYNLFNDHKNLFEQNV